jgi:hypothetical protein
MGFLQHNTLLVRWIAGAILIPLSAIAQATAQGQSSARITYTEESPYYQPTKYTLSIDESGVGHYRSEVGKTTVTDSGDLAVVPLDVSIAVSQALRAKLFLIARRRRFFSVHCDANGDKPHVQSTKTLEYSGPDGSGHCTYIWSKDDQISDATDVLEGIRATIEEGARLGLIYKYQRLGLDKELEHFAEQVEGKQALEIGNIAPLLRKIARDDALMQRCRVRAQQILTVAKIE